MHCNITSCSAILLPEKVAYSVIPLLHYSVFHLFLSPDGNSQEDGKTKLLVLICNTRSILMIHLTLVCSLFSFATIENQ